jgi:hypothetical protein
MWQESYTGREGKAPSVPLCSAETKRAGTRGAESHCRSGWDLSTHPASPPPIPAGPRLEQLLLLAFSASRRLEVPGAF